jgi:hypothetical protein
VCSVCTSSYSTCLHTWCAVHFNVARIPCCLYTVQTLYYRAKISFLPCGVTARTKYIFLFWGCGIEKREFLAYFGAFQAKIPVRGWCKLNISRVRGWCGSAKPKYFFGAAYMYDVFVHHHTCLYHIYRRVQPTKECVKKTPIHQYKICLLRSLNNSCSCSRGERFQPIKDHRAQLNDTHHSNHLSHQDVGTHVHTLACRCTGDWTLLNALLCAWNKGAEFCTRQAPGSNYKVNIQAYTHTNTHTSIHTHTNTHPHKHTSARAHKSKITPLGLHST